MFTDPAARTGESNGQMGWDFGTFGQDVARSIVSIHLVDQGLPAPQPIGSAFIVGRIGDRVLALTATHVFSEIRKILVSPHRFSIPEDFQNPHDISPFLLQGRVVAVLPSKNGNLQEWPVIAYNGYVGSDVTAFFVKPPKEAWSDFPPVLAIDTTIPGKSAEIAVMSYGGMNLHSDTNGRWQERTDIQATQRSSCRQDSGS